MSRSYKKYPYAGDNVKRKERKRLANQSVRTKLRSFDELPQRNSYRKMYESYDICDYYDDSTWEEYKRFRIENGLWRGDKIEWAYYMKCYIRK